MFKFSSYLSFISISHKSKLHSEFRGKSGNCSNSTTLCSTFLHACFSSFLFRFRARVISTGFSARVHPALIFEIQWNRSVEVRYVINIPSVSPRNSALMKLLLQRLRLVPRPCAKGNTHAAAERHSQCMETTLAGVSGVVPYFAGQKTPLIQNSMTHLEDDADFATRQLSHHQQIMRLVTACTHTNSLEMISQIVKFIWDNPYRLRCQFQS